MSSDLSKARSLLSQVKTNLKQEKFIPAVQGLRDALVLVLSNPLMKAEKEEFTELLDKAVFVLDSDPNFRQLVPLKITYVPGEEKPLLDDLHKVLAELQDTAVDNAKEAMEAMRLKRENDLARGKRLIDEQKFDEAGVYFKEMLVKYADDPDIKAEIGELFLEAARYVEAYEYLSMALQEAPDSIHLYNRVGIALRKMGKFETAEKYYSRAMEIAHDDPNLYFNVGRLYVDWGKWARVEAMARKALQYNPGFTEAEKMLNFARKKIEKGE